MEPFCNIIKWAIIQWAFGHKMGLWSWSKVPLCKVVQTSFIRPFLCCGYWNIATCLILKNSAVIPDINVVSICKPNNW